MKDILLNRVKPIGRALSYLIMFSLMVHAVLHISELTFVKFLVYVAIQLTVEFVIAVILAVFVRNASKKSA